MDDFQRLKKKFNYADKEFILAIIETRSVMLYSNKKLYVMARKNLEAIGVEIYETWYGGKWYGIVCEKLQYVPTKSITYSQFSSIAPSTKKRQVKAKISDCYRAINKLARAKHRMASCFGQSQQDLAHIYVISSDGKRFTTIYAK